MAAVYRYIAMEPTPSPSGEVFVSMENFRNAKIQLQSEGAGCQYALNAKLDPAATMWAESPTLPSGTVPPQSSVIVEVQGHYPELRLTFMENAGILTVWVCLSERMEN